MNDLDWPASETETIAACPVCGSAHRTLLHAALTDRIFFAAPGRWQMWRCAECGSGYIDPRPTPASIGRAYASYYTHDQDLPASGIDTRPGLAARLKRAALNDHLNARYGYSLRPALPGGRLAFALAPAKACDAGEMIRHLPAPGPGGRLLDIGCGNGLFLLLARDRLGYEVEGTEIDGTAAARGTARGLNIRTAPLPGTGLPACHYTQITLNHVLEHTHDPVAALREVYDLLVPGGRVWIQVPNLNGASHTQFSPDCRLLEPPRHLVMFTPGSLRLILGKAGFINLERLDVPNRAVQFYEAGWKIAHSTAPGQTPPPLPAALRAKAKAAEHRHGGLANAAEVITMTGFRAIDD